MATLKETLDRLFGEKKSDSLSQDKKEAILNVSINVFAECGYHKADVQEIANRANVGKGTVYRHFYNKEHLFWAATVWVGERLHVLSRPIIESDENFITKLRKLVKVRADFFYENPDVLELSAWQRAMFRGTMPPEIGEYANRHFFEPFHVVVQEGVKHSVHPKVEKLDIFVFSMISAIHGALMSYCYVKDRISLHEHINCAFEPILRQIDSTPE
ncbi:MAG: TetR/AcrR family transcriptional regulator [Thermoguttaceae bacterium]